MDRKGDWIQTYTGKDFWPLDPREEDIDIEDVAHALSLKCRFNGHCSKFYSVAHHSVLVAIELYLQYKDKDIALAGLLHDAAEAYLCDIPRPIKPLLTNFKEIEENIMKFVCQKYGITYPLDKRVKEYDNILLATEARDLMGHDCLDRWNLPYEPLLYKIKPYSAEESKDKFLTAFKIFYNTNNMTSWTVDQFDLLHYNVVVKPNL